MTYESDSWRFTVAGSFQTTIPWNKTICKTEFGCPVLGNWAHRCEDAPYDTHIECITPPIYDYQGYFKIHNGFELAAEVTWAEKFHSSLDYCFNWCKTKMKCAIVKGGSHYYINY